MKIWEHNMRMNLNDMKNSYYVHMAEYAVNCRIAGNPEFSWWIRHVLAKRNHIIGKLKSKYWFRTQKFSIKIPNSVQKGKDFDDENGNTLLWDAICK